MGVSAISSNTRGYSKLVPPNTSYTPSGMWACPPYPAIQEATASWYRPIHRIHRVVCGRICRIQQIGYSKLVPPITSYIRRGILACPPYPAIQEATASWYRPIHRIHRVVCGRVHHIQQYKRLQQAGTAQYIVYTEWYVGEYAVSSRLVTASLYHPLHPIYREVFGRVRHTQQYKRLQQAGTAQYIVYTEWYVGVSAISSNTRGYSKLVPLNTSYTPSGMWACPPYPAIQEATASWYHPIHRIHRVVCGRICRIQQIGYSKLVPPITSYIRRGIWTCPPYPAIQEATASWYRPIHRIHRVVCGRICRIQQIGYSKLVPPITSYIQRGIWTCPPYPAIQEATASWYRPIHRIHRVVCGRICRIQQIGYSKLVPPITSYIQRGIWTCPPYPAIQEATASWYRPIHRIHRVVCGRICRIQQIGYSKLAPPITSYIQRGIWTCPPYPVIQEATASWYRPIHRIHRVVCGRVRHIQQIGYSKLVPPITSYIRRGIWTCPPYPAIQEATASWYRPIHRIHRVVCGRICRIQQIGYSKLAPPITSYIQRGIWTCPPYPVIQEATASWYRPIHRIHRVVCGRVRHIQQIGYSKLAPPITSYIQRGIWTCPPYPVIQEATASWYRPIHRIHRVVCGRVRHIQQIGYSKLVPPITSYIRRGIWTCPPYPAIQEATASWYRPIHRIHRVVCGRICRIQQIGYSKLVPPITSYIRRGILDVSAISSNTRGNSKQIRPITSHTPSGMWACPPYPALQEVTASRYRPLYQLLHREELVILNQPEQALIDKHNTTPMLTEQSEGHGLIGVRETQGHTM